MTALFNERCQTRGEYDKQWAWHESELRNRLTQILSTRAAGQPMRIYIDALDEGGEETAIQLIEHLQDIINCGADTGISIHVVFSCRHYPIIALDGFTIDVEKENSSDIETYVSQQFAAHAINPTKAIPLGGSILARAKGIFQWITLVLPRVISECKRGKGVEAIQQTIKRLPPQLHDLYEVFLTNIPDEDRAQSINLIRLVVFGARPLSVSEVRHAILIGPECSYQTWQEYLDDENFIASDKDMEQRIIDLSQGLLEIRQLRDDLNKDGAGRENKEKEATGQNVVQVIHESVVDYLITGWGLQILLNNQENISLGKEHANLAWICLRYMFLDEVSSAWRNVAEALSSPWYVWNRIPGAENQWRSVLASHPFLEYAFEEWTEHVGKANRSETGVQCLSKLFPFFRASFEQHIEHWSSIYSANENLTFSSTELGRGTTIQHIIAHKGWLNFTKELSSLDGLDMGVKDCQDRTPLHLATMLSRQGMVEMLVQRSDVDVNAVDGFGRTPLAWAARNGDLENVKTLLMQKGNSGDHGDHRGQTPLFGAAEMGNEDVVRLLLRCNDVNTNGKDVFGRSPLWYAAKHGNEAAVKLFLEQDDIEADSRDTYGQSPLSVAAAMEHELVVELFLARPDVEADSRDIWGRSPFTHAVARGYRKTVLLFLKREDVDTSGFSDTVE